MKALICEHCGGDEFIEKDGYRICRYCKSRFIPSKDDKPAKAATISLNSDVERLLNKCKTDPSRAKKYAALILEMDPANKEAKAILNIR